MAGPTTEVLNDDIRILRDEVHGVDLDVRELSTKVGGILTSIKLFAIFVFASVMGSVWWGGALTSKVDGLGIRLDKVEARSEKLETKVDGLGTRLEKLETRVGAIESRLDKFEAKVDARFDRLEGMIGKLLDPSRPAVKP